MKEQEQLHTQTRGWWRNKKIQKSWLKTKGRETWQQGGTILIAINNITSHTEGSREDERQLGQWAWITIGDPTRTTHTMIITLYYPCTNIGTHTVIIDTRDNTQLHRISI